MFFEYREHILARTPNKYQDLNSQYLMLFKKKSTMHAFIIVAQHF